MRSGGMPVSREAIAFAASIVSRSTMQLSITAIAAAVLPSSSTIARTWSGSSDFSAMVSVRLPAVRMGNVGGEMPTSAAPALKTGSSAWTLIAVNATRTIGRTVPAIF